MSGLSFGKRGAKLYARIYDKSREVNDTGHQWWPEAWGPKYDPDRKVLRVEFELRRAGLVEFGVDTPEDALGPRRRAVGVRGRLLAVAARPERG